jgi:hypothetical protein
LSDIAHVRIRGQDIAHVRIRGQVTKFVFRDLTPVRRARRRGCDDALLLADAEAFEDVAQQIVGRAPSRNLLQMR